MAETDTPNWLNSSFFETALRAGGYGPRVAVTACQIGRATVAGDNSICAIYRAKLRLALKGRLSSLSLIVKSEPAQGEMFKVNISFFIILDICKVPIFFILKTLILKLIHYALVRIYVLQRVIYGVNVKLNPSTCLNKKFT
jgi:hypothetical protein